MGFIFNFLGRNICFLGKLLLATSISTNAGQFLLSKLVAVLIVMNFGDIFRANLHLRAMTSPKSFSWVILSLLLSFPVGGSIEVGLSNGMPGLFFLLDIYAL